MTTTRRDLSRREQEIYDLMVMGFRSEEIQAKLNLKRSSVSAHLSSIYRKTGCRGRLEVVMQYHREKKA